MRGRYRERHTKNHRPSESTENRLVVCLGYIQLVELLGASWNRVFSYQVDRLLGRQDTHTSILGVLQLLKYLSNVPGAMLVGTKED